VALLDGNAYFNRPGPRLYRAIEVLADTLHPDLSVEPPPAEWERQALSPEARPSATAPPSD
jgi:iron complex transport system substrate-binding protein